MIPWSYSTYPAAPLVASQTSLASIPCQACKHGNKPLTRQTYTSTAAPSSSGNHHYPTGGPFRPFRHNYCNSSLGMGDMMLAAQRYYPVPYHSDPIANFSAWCHTTQILQADFYRSQIAYYRRGSGLPERQLGSLYCQLEDIWQAPTWAGIEYDGRWKVLHYVVRNIYQPVIIASYWNYTTGDLTAYVTSDLWDEVDGTAKLAWYGYDGTLLEAPTNVDFAVGGLNITQILQTPTPSSTLSPMRSLR